MTTVTKMIPDPAEDFDGCIQAMVDQAIAEVEGMTEEEMDDHYLWKAIEHVLKIHALDAPKFLIDMANKRLHRHLLRLQTRERAKRAAETSN